MSPFPPPRRVYIETYGCQMNVADSEIVGSILKGHGYDFTDRLDEADVVLVNTCAVRDNAEQRIYGRLGLFRSFRRRHRSVVVGILGCMAERLRSDLLAEDLVDLVVGPDEYRRLPLLIDRAFMGEQGIAVRLSRVENYDDIMPLRTTGVSAWLAIMRGCDKFCTFCVVPFTRGRERSRPLAGIVDEVRALAARGFREVSLLGQNVNSYRDGGHAFPDVLRAVATVDRMMRVRFTTSHPQDMSDDLIDAIAHEENVCKHIHLPVQSGSDRILRLMNRTYTTDHYRRLVEKIRARIPGVSLSTDVISGFPGETQAEHQMTVDLLREIRFDGAFTFKYSPREHTKAWTMSDDVTEEEKGRRVNEITELQHKFSQALNAVLIGTTQRILVDGPSRKSALDFTGRTDTNKSVVFPHGDEQAGQYVDVRVDRVNSATLFGVRTGGTQRSMEETAA
ncbi:MAG: tRNA (N6-isopentenyl adenosine(37)-C2)-methylthiotransferase MiaB [Bacteroidota bacterium]